MQDREALTRLRALVVRRDGAALVAALDVGPWPGDSLQLIGDGLLAAIRDRVDRSAELGAQCVAALSERRWDGDQELVNALKAAMGTGPTPLLRPLLVDLEEVAMILEGDPDQGGGRIELTTGEVWPRAALDYAEETRDLDEADDPDRWLWVESDGSRDGYRDMVWFIEDVEDPGIADRLSIAITGREASGGSRTPSSAGRSS
jgi:hypothetical protein